MFGLQSIIFLVNSYSLLLSNKEDVAVAPLPSAMSRVEWTRECALTTPQQAERAERTLKS
jgi:hypothetical protein